MLARLAGQYPNEKAIDDALLDTYREINGKINSLITQHEKKFHDAQMKFAHAQTKKETLQAQEDMTTHATVCDRLEEVHDANSSKIIAIEHKYEPKEEDYEPNEDYDRYFLE